MRAEQAAVRELRAAAAAMAGLAKPAAVRRLTAAADAVMASYRAGGQLLAFGNGGSAADAQHLVAELVVRLRFDRPALPAVALSVNPSLVTAAANDFGYDAVFVRQVEAHVRPGDVAVAISTSGTSPGVVQAAAAARQRGAVVIGLTGRTGGTLKRHCDHWLPVAAAATPHVQEGHIAMIHVLCRLVEDGLFGAQGGHTCGRH
ncbi:MAG TPA: SIS domain-containing protein [bacterium]|nr:SIS domain-containing protein [bacterium]